MYKSILTTLCIAIVANTLLSQNTISGKVYDDNNEEIFYATAAIYDTDNNLVKAESTQEDGSFIISGIKDGSYRMEINMLSYNNYEETIEFPRDNNKSLIVTLSPDSEILNEVEITARVPLMEQKPDKLIVNVENNITNTSGNLLDVMKKVPGMLVINDRLSMAGQSNPTILINGKSTQYMDVQSLLRDMPGDNIKKVEIIHQPGAEYEAAGTGPIINIIMKKNSLFGTNGSINIGAGRGDLWKYNTGLNISHYQGKLNLTGGLGYSKNAWVENLSLIRRLNGISPTIDGVYDQVNMDAAEPVTYRGNLRADYDITNKHRIGFEGKIYDNTNKRISTNETKVDLTNEQMEDFVLNTDNDIDRGWQYGAINPYYIFEIDSNGTKLEFDVNIARYKINGLNTLTTTNTINSDVEQQRYNQPGDTKIFASKLDFTKSLNDNMSLQAGIKYSKADLDNNLMSEFFDPIGGWTNNEHQSNHYLFDEKIYAAYGKLNWQSGDWSGTAGLRYEQSESIGNSLTLDSTLTRNISKLFPSMSVSKKLGPLAATAAYSYRIDRPRYSTLNPFVYYLDPFTFEQGNPNIRPELTHSAKFTLSMEGQPFFNLEYKRSNDAIVEVTRQEPNSEEASKTDINFDVQNTYSASLFFPIDFIPGVAGGYGGVIINRNEFNSFYLDSQFDRSKWTTTAFIQAEFNLPFDIHGEIGGWFNSGEQEGIFNSEYLYGSSLGLSKKFLDDKAKISFGIEDLFNRFWHANVDYQQDMDLLVTWQAPVYNMRFSYKFGNQHLKSKKKTRNSASEELQRASQGK